MATVQTRGESQRSTAAMVGAAMAVAAMVWLTWLAWDAARAALLQREVAAAVLAGDPDRAASALDRLIRYRPDDIEAVRHRVELALQRGDREAAVRALAAVPEGTREAGSAHFRRGLLLKDLFRVREAEAALREAARLTPGAIEPRRELVSLLGIERRAAEQEKELWDMYDQGLRPVEALRLLAQSDVIIPPGALAKTSDEGAALERCLESDPTDPHLRPALARYYRMRGQADAALRLLDSWLSQHPDDAEARVAWLAVLLDESDVERTSHWFMEPSHSLRGRAEYWRLRGDWLDMQDRPGDAVADYREAVRLAPRDPETRHRLAQSLRASGREAEGAEALMYHERLREFARLAAAVSQDAPTLDSVLATARACRALGPAREREARAWFTQALKLEPGNAEARAALKPADRAVHPRLGQAAGP